MVKERVMKIVNTINENKNKVVLGVGTTAMVAMSQVSVFAEETHTATSLIPDELKTIISDTGADMKATVVAMLILLIPVSLSIWGLTFGAKKGIGLLKKFASKIGL